MFAPFFACVFFISLAVCQSSAIDKNPVVEVTGGKILGTSEYSTGGQPYYSFRAVPYAGPTSGKNRLKAPVPVDPWTDVLSAVSHGEYCAQSARGWKRGVEDCLHLSVYTPQLTRNVSSSLPVLVWFHGGSFVSGGAADYDASSLMTENMVVVIPQYRLGILGFFDVPGSSPGNYGMLDQVAALRWVRDNIGTFGGDPQQVTIGGDDAGGASALYHMVSQKSKGLFSKVISVSGSPLNPWARHLVMRQSRMVYSIKMGCPRYSGEAMVKCFREMDIDFLLNRQPFAIDSFQEVPDLMYIGSNNLAPSVQSPDHGNPEDLFITSEPLLNFTQGNFAKVPVLLMSAKDEGNYIVNNVIDSWIKTKKGTPDVDNDIFDSIVDYMGVLSKSTGKVQILRQKYMLAEKNANYQDKLKGIATMLGDAVHNSGLLQTAKYLNDHTPTYMMRFDYEAGPHATQFNTSLNYKAIPQGAGHGDMVSHMFSDNSADKKEITKLLTNIIANFASGELPPQEKWPVFTDDKLDAFVLREDGALKRDALMSESRRKSCEMIFNDHFRSELGLAKRLLPRDEL